MQTTSSAPKRGHFDPPMQQESSNSPHLPIDMILKIFSLCNAKSIEKGKMACKDYQFHLLEGSLDYWQSRANRGNLYTSTDVQSFVEFAKKDNTLDKIKVKSVGPVERLRLIVELTHLVSFRLIGDPFEPYRTPILQWISACSGLKELELDSCLIAHSALSFANLTNIEKITTNFSGEHPYDKFHYLPKLKELSAGTQLREQSLTELGKCTALEKLSLVCPDLFDDVGNTPQLSDLKNLTNLKELELIFEDQPKDTEAMFEALSLFTSLSRLHISTEQEGFCLVQVPCCLQDHAENELFKWENMTEIYIQALMTRLTREEFVGELFMFPNLKRLQIVGFAYEKKDGRVSEMKAQFPPPPQTY